MLIILELTWEQHEKNHYSFPRYFHLAKSIVNVMFINKKVLAVIFLTIIALLGLGIYSFGPYAKVKKTAVTQNVKSFTPVSSKSTVVNNQSITFSTYQNKDTASDFYSISFPTIWQVNKGRKGGDYLLQFAKGDGQVILLEVADNTTLELLVLSQEEPQLKKTIPAYKRIDYKKVSIQGNDAFQLSYTSNAADGSTNQTIKTYITGSDLSSVITLTTLQSNFSSMEPLFTSVINSFQWNNQ